MSFYLYYAARGVGAYLHSHRLHGVEVEDLEAYARMGVMRAVESYSSEKGIWSAHCVLCVRYSILDGLRAEGRTKRKHGRQRGPKVGTRPSHAFEELPATTHERDSPLERAASAELPAVVRKHCGRREAQVVLSYYWGHKTQGEIGERYGLTESAISLVRQAAIRKLREVLQEAEWRQ